MLKKILSKISTKQWLLLILVLSAVLRLVKLPEAYYGTTGELYRDMLVVYKFVFQGNFPLLGPSSSLGGFSFGPIYYYILTPFVLLFSFSPIGAVFVSVVFSVLTIYLVYKISYLWFGKNYIALLTAFLLGISVRDIQNAYYISNPNILPFFSLIFVYSLIKIRQQEVRLIWWVVLGLSFAVATQLHSTATFVLPPLAVLSLYKVRKSLLIKHIVGFFVPVVVLYTPYLIYEFTHNFENFRHLLFLGSGNFGMLPNVKSLVAIISFFDSVFLFRNDFFNLYEVKRNVYFALLPFYFLIIGWFFVWYRKREAKKKFVPMNYNTTFVIFSWLAVGLAMFLFFKFYIQFFYFLIIWPLPIFLLSWFVVWIRENKSFLWCYIVTVYVLVQAVQLFYLFPVISHPEFDHKSMVTLFTKIKEESKDENFKVINSYVDINLFTYYTELLNIPSNGARSQVVYTISDSFNRDTLAVNPEKYEYIKEFSTPGVLVKKYIVRP